MSKNPQANIERMFHGWYAERKQQLEKSLANTVANGNLINEHDIFKSGIRNLAFKLMNINPNVRRDLGRGPRREGLFKCTWADSLAFLENFGGGGCFSQVFVSDLSSYNPVFLNNQIWNPQKRKLLQLVVLLDNATEIGAIARAINMVKLPADAAQFLDLAETTLLINDLNWDKTKQTSAGGGGAGGNGNAFRVVNMEELIAKPVSSLPHPEGYDCMRIRKEHPETRYIILRPDKYVFGQGRSIDELIEIMQKPPGMLL